MHTPVKTIIILTRNHKEEQSMKNSVMVGWLLAAGLTIGSSMAFSSAQESTDQGTAPNDKAEVLKSLDAMSGYLRSLDRFAIEADVNVDEVLSNGQKIQLSRSLQVKTDKPSKLWARTSSMYSIQEFYYNGEFFTISTPELGYYASFAAPATIGKVIVAARDKYNIEMPLSDLFLWRSEQDTAKDIDDAFVVGIDQINGIDCTQYALSGKEIDWQIWIQAGDTPLPLKMVITSKKEVSQPQYSVVMNWDTAPQFKEDIFTFVPADGSQKINFQTIMANKQEKKQ